MLKRARYEKGTHFKQSKRIYTTIFFKDNDILVYNGLCVGVFKESEEKPDKTKKCR